MTGRGVGMKALSGHQVYLTSAINPLTVRTLRGLLRQQDINMRVMHTFTQVHIYSIYRLYIYIYRLSPEMHS